MGFEFGNPAMLLGTLLFTVPLIIHLFNRRRYRMKRWAAMDFLMTAYRRTRRRLRLENFLLLLLRCLIIILLALAMAKPFVSSQSAMAAFSTERRDVVIVLDYSYSMGYRLAPDETCFDLARKKIGALLSKLDGGRGDTVTMLLMGKVPEFVIPYQSPPEEALARLERIREPAPLTSDFTALANLLAGEISDTIRGGKEVYIFTDLQAVTFGAGSGGERASTAALLAVAAEKGAAIRIVDVGRQESHPNNTAVTAVATLEPFVTTDAPVTFVATVRNFGERGIEDGRGAFVLDGKALETKSFSLKPGARATVESTLRVHDEGFHTIAFSLEPDDLTLDDERWFAFEARQAVSVLLVDGNPSGDSYRSATGALKRVINPVRIDGGLERGTVFEPEVKDFRLLNAGRIRLDRYDCILLVDVEGFSAEAAESLQDYVRGGGALVLFMGDHVDLEAYNQRLYAASGDRLLPVRLEGVLGENEGIAAVSYFRLRVEEARHPLFELFNDPKYRPLLAVPFFRFVQVGEVPEDVRVLARFFDVLNRSWPAVLEHAVGRGKVILFTTSASSDWSLLPESPVTFLPLVHSLLYYLTSRDADRNNLEVGDKIHRSVQEFPERIAVKDPSGNQVLITESVERREFGRYVLPLENTPLEAVGPYLLEVDFTPSGTMLREVFTANVNPTEGNLRRIDPENLPSLFPGSEIEVVDPTVQDPTGGKEGTGKGEMWKPLLIALLALAGLELLLAWKFGDYS